MAKKRVKPTVKNKKWVKKKNRKKERKLGGWWLVANIVSFGLVIGTAVVIFFGDRPGDKSAATQTESAQVKPSTKKVTVYFGSRDGESLRGSTVNVKEGRLSDEIAEAVELLLKKPDNRGKKRKNRVEKTLPPGTRLLGVRVKGNTAVVNMSKEIRDKHPGGTAAEMQTIYSIVNTVALGWPEINDVQLLVEGKRVETIAGHISIKLPIRPNRLVNAD